MPLSVERRMAAVTVISDLKNVVLIKRIERFDDPWSGDMALPGGLIEQNESDLEAAVRECREEIGFFPSRSVFFGTYETVKLSVKVSAFVDIESLPDHFIPGSEVDSIYIVKIGSLVPSIDRRGFSCFLFGENEIWGLTYRILRDFIERFYTK